MSNPPLTLPAASQTTADLSAPQQVTPQPKRASFLLALGVCAICGLLMAWPFRSYDGSLPSFVALAPVLWIVTQQRRKLHAALCASVFAIAWTMPCFTFLWPLTGGGSIALSIYTSLFYVAGLLLIRRVARGGGTLAVIGTASAWVLIEIARTIVPVFGFPWLLLGHTLLYNDHLRQGADLFGVYGLSFVVVCVNAALAFGLPELFATGLDHTRRHRAWKALCFAGALWLGAFCYGEARIRNLENRLIPGPPIGLIQGNILQKLGRSPEEMEHQLFRHIELHKQLLQLCKDEHDPPVMVCWAETMVPGTLNADDWGKTFKTFVGTTGIPTLTGSNFIPPEEQGREHARIHNTVYYFDQHGDEVFHVFKRRLVPFGEYIPFASQVPFLLYFQAVTRDQYTPGTEPSPVGQAGLYHFAINICVEDIHPDLARECCRSGADTLINVTNDGWFHGTYGPRAHFLAAAWRAIEVRRPMLRVTNTGITAAIDPLGNASIVIPPETEGIAKVRLLGISDGTGQFAKPKTLTMLLGEIGTGAIFLSIFLGCIFFTRKQP